MALPTGWPPRPASGRRSIRFYKIGTLTASYADNAFLFLDNPEANTIVPVPFIRPGENTRVHIGGESGPPYGTGQRADERYRPDVFQRGTGGGTAEFTLIGIAATGQLGGVNPADTDTVTIDAKVYTFQAILTDVDGNVQRGGDLATSLANLAGAITLTGVPGTDYATSMTLHPTVTAVSTLTTLDATAKIVGPGGNSIVTTSTGGNVTWGGGTLSGGSGGDDVELYLPAATPTFSDVLIGKEIVIAGSTSAGNDGAFVIASVPSPYTLRWPNLSGVTELFPIGGTYSIRFIEEGLKKASIWAGTIKITNKGANILYLSFDGETDQGEVQPAAGGAPTTAVYRNRHEAGIAVKGTATDAYVIEAW